MLRPVWERDGQELTGWAAAAPTAVKRSHLQHSPHFSVTCWSPSHGTSTAEVSASWITGHGELETLWGRFATAPAPIGSDPSIIPSWDAADSPTFSGLDLRPWRLRVFPGTLLTGGPGEILTRRE